MPVSGRSVDCDTDIEHNMKIANVMASIGRVKVTVSGQGWLKNEKNRDSQELVTERGTDGCSTRFEKLQSIFGRSHVGCINNRILFE